MKVLKGAILLLALAVSARGLYAVPAYPYPIEVTQPDGSKLTLRLHGDEFYHWMTTEDGYYLTKSKEGFYCYATPDFAGGMISTGVIAHNPAQRTLQERSSLTPQTRASLGIAPSITAGFNRKRYGKPMNMEKVRAGFDADGRETRTALQPAKALVILVNFSDLAFTVPAPLDSFDRMLNQDGYSEHGAKGSARDYFLDNTGGALAVQFDVVGPVTLPQRMLYYGGNLDGDIDSPHAQEMALETCRLAKSRFGVDFSRYANENNEVENVFIYYAGKNEAESGNEDEVWPHSWIFPDGSSIDGVRLYAYACTSELTYRYYTTNNVPTYGMASIGTFCHEFGHILGLPDLYDTDGEENGYSIGLDVLSLMSRGGYNYDGAVPAGLTSLEQELLGVQTTQPLPAGQGITLAPVMNGRSYIHETENEYEYFFFENRSSSEKWDAHIGGRGLVIYHVDISDRIVAPGYRAVDLWRENMVNIYSAHECVSLVSPRPAEKNRYVSPYDDVDPDILFYPYVSVTSFGRTTMPAFRSWEGREQGLMLSEISAGGRNVTMDVGAAAFSVSNIPIPNTLTALNSGSTVWLNVDTANSPSDLRWYIDDSLYARPTVTLSKGEHKLKAVFTNDGGNVEVLVKYVRVI